MGEIIRGALLTVDDLSSIQEEPAIVQASDGTTTVTDIMGLVPGTGGVLTPVFTPDHYVCEDLEIFTGHPPLLNGGLALGADPAVGTALPLDGSGNLMMDYSLGHAFEVRGTIIVPGPVFDEGQDVAYTIMLSGAVVSTATGQRRTPANRSVLSGSYVAPVPIPIAGSGVHPPMVFDNYDHHPNIGYLWRNNTPTGPQFSFVKSKGVEFQNGNMLMIWADKPSHRLDAGTNMNGGFYAVFYFRAWMDPDLTKCEKHFLVEIEVDGSGVVTKNELRMR